MVYKSKAPASVFTTDTGEPLPTNRRGGIGKSPGLYSFVIIIAKMTGFGKPPPLKGWLRIV